MQISNPKVSIIVPVHNAGERLYKCLDTLVNQTLREIEIILVLDCPTDGSDRIAEEYAAKDDRIVILKNPENLHIGKSRNRGLEMAQGEFIGFSDHDDYRELDMYEKLYQQAKSGDLDMVLGANYYFDTRITSTAIPDGLDGDALRVFLLNDLLADGDDNVIMPFATNVHPNLYRTSFVQKHNLEFVDTRQFSPEDRIFQLKCLILAHKVGISFQRNYYHILHENSAVNDTNYKSCLTRANGKRLVFDILKETGNYDKFRIPFLQSVKKEFTECLLNSFITTKKLSVFNQNKAFLKSFSFCSEAFNTSRYSLKNFRPGGKLMRLLIFLIMSR